MHKLASWVLGVASLLPACDTSPAARAPDYGSTVAPAPEKNRLVLVHTADLHSHLFPEPTLIGSADAARGLGPSGTVSAVGGVARIATLVRELRSGGAPTLYFDSGDLIEGTAVFNAFGGEPELRAMSALGPAAVALGNHDLDPGLAELVSKHRKFARFPVLAANYHALDSGLAGVLGASLVLDAGGLRVGVIGVANPTSPGGLEQDDNPYGIVLVPSASAVQSAIDALRPKVDLIVAITHLGLAADEALIEATSGLDVVLGGHQHLTLDQPVERTDCGTALQAARGCRARRVIVVHSGALGRYVGRLELALAPVAPGAGDSGDGLEVVTAKHELLPVSADVPEDAAVAELLEPYRARLAAAGLGQPVAFALGPVERYGVTGGDSPLGNLIADAIRERAGSDFALLNTTGIRADLPPGVLSKSTFVSALPFADALTVVTLTGAEMTALLDQQAQVAKSRHCESPLQISGFSWTVVCTGARAGSRALLGPGSTEPARALDPSASYTLATTAYLADGGSGFEILTKASARRELEIEPLDVLLAQVARLPSCAASTLPCLDPGPLRDGRIVALSQ